MPWVSVSHWCDVLLCVSGRLPVCHGSVYPSGVMCCFVFQGDYQCAMGQCIPLV